MKNEEEIDKNKIGIGIIVFRPGTPFRVKVRGILFFSILCLIILIQSFYWLFANSVNPILLGMPFGMFFTVLFVAIEFAVFLILYFLESEEMDRERGLG